MAHCVFCRIVAGETPAAVVDSDERTLSFMDINPGTRGHALVIPKAHAEDLYSVDPEDLAACAIAAQRLARRARDGLGAAGVNVLNACRSAAGQSVFHFHLHVVPRYAGDGLVAPWRVRPGDPAVIAAAAEGLRSVDRA